MKLLISFTGFQVNNAHHTAPAHAIEILLEPETVWKIEAVDNGGTLRITKFDGTIFLSNGHIEFCQ